MHVIQILYKNNCNFLTDVLIVVYCYLTNWASLVAQLVKESTCNVGHLGLIPGLGRSPGEGKGYSLQYSGLETSTDCVVLGVAKSQTRLSDFDFSLKFPVSGIFLPRSHCLTSLLGSGLSQHLATPTNNPLMEEMQFLPVSALTS